MTFENAKYEKCCALWLLSVLGLFIGSISMIAFADTPDTPIVKPVYTIVLICDLPAAEAINEVGGGISLEAQYGPVYIGEGAPSSEALNAPWHITDQTYSASLYSKEFPKTIADVTIDRADGTIVKRRGSLGGMIAVQRGKCKKPDKPNI